MTGFSGTLAELKQRLEEDLLEHQKTDKCKCPFPCPKCGTTAHWDMGLEGHWCSKCDWYDGDK